MINFGLDVALVGMATLCTAVYIGLGFLARPSRASAVWSFSFALAMIASYGSGLGGAIDSPVWRAASSGALLGAVAFVWVGFRARRGLARTMWITATSYTVLATALLAATCTTDAYGLVFRVVFVGAGAISVLIIIEIVRVGRQQRDVALPLAIASTGFVVFAVIAVIDGVVRLSSGVAPASADSLQLLRELNAMASLLYLAASLVTLLLLTRDSGVSAPRVAASPFRVVAADRLERAQAADDEWWSVLDIRLDDPADLREASSPSAFDRVTERFLTDVRAVLPAVADIEVRGTTTVVALVPLPAGALRQVLARLLERIATTSDDQPIAVRLSASIGWAGVDQVGYDLDDLLGAAHAAATRAQLQGGDRWERHLVAA